MYSIFEIKHTIEGNTFCSMPCIKYFKGAQWLSGSVVECLTRDRVAACSPHRRTCVVSLSKNIIPCSVLVQPRKARPFITERLLMGRKESNQTNKCMMYFRLRNACGSSVSEPKYSSVHPYIKAKTFTRSSYTKIAITNILANSEDQDNPISSLR